MQIEDGQRFGLRNLRHSLSNWLVNKAKVEPKTVQGILRHSRIQTTLDLYTHEDSDEARGAQGEFLKAVGMHSGIVQQIVVWVELWVGDCSNFSSNPLKDMVGPCGLEPQTSTVVLAKIQSACAFNSIRRCRPQAKCDNTSA